MRSISFSVVFDKKVLLGRVAMFFYWIFDNIQILSQLKILNADPEFFGKWGMTNWSVSLVCNLIQFIRQLKQLNEQLAYFADIVSKNPEKKEAFKDQIKATKIARFDCSLNIIKTLGDILPAFKGASSLSLLRNHRQTRSVLCQ